MAAAKAGFLIADIDHNILSVPQLREALKLAQPKAIFFHPITETCNNLELLRKSIPEFYYCNKNYIICFFQIALNFILIRFFNVKMMTKKDKCFTLSISPN
jgi:hypothetical protein